MEMRWCAVCGRFVSNDDHESDPRFAEYHDGPATWEEALEKIPA